jgi:superfamily II DNA or RNA helicase
MDMTGKARAPQDLVSLRARLAELEAERTAISAEIERLEQVEPRTEAAGDAPVNRHSPPAAKIALFRELFRGRADVYPVRWENPKTGRSGYAPACANEWKSGLCGKPAIKCTACPNQAFLPITDGMIARHLKGHDDHNKPFVSGIYPLLPDDQCAFLAADFDEGDWQRDVRAFVAVCRQHDLPVAIERSRSGKGAHAWLFFAQPIPAIQARRLGALMITRTLDHTPDLGFKSYDRLFPSQDHLTEGGLGNLIALPLQGVARRAGNSVFVDDNLAPFPDQWSFLACQPRIETSRVDALVEQGSRTGGILSVRLPTEDDDAEPWLLPPSRRKAVPPPVYGSLPAALTVVLADQLYIPRGDLPPQMVAQLMRVVAFQNPEFYEAQALRLSTYDKPRIICCAELTSRHVGLPRGGMDSALEILRTAGIAVTLHDERTQGTPIQVTFHGTLRPDQQQAAKALVAHDTGVLAATTAFGKTVVAAHMIAARGVNTLVLVHRRPLIAQWQERLSTFLGLDRKAIGIIGGGKRKPTGVIDIATLQSLFDGREVDDQVAEYGQVIVDECHHLAANRFEQVARRSRARYVLGLSATPTRKDGRHPIIFMQCGPVRWKTDARAEAVRRPFHHQVRIRETSFHFPADLAAAPSGIQALYGALAVDAKRNDLIFNDVLTALEAGRSPLVITERAQHAELLASRLSRFAANVVLLRGGRSARERHAAEEQLAAVRADQERVIVATGRYLGEGFDDPRLDTLFLTLPIAWRGTLAQYAGRLHRLYDGKHAVVIYDYVDSAVPVLARMAAKRRKGYTALGYEIGRSGDLFEDASSQILSGSSL